MSRLEGCGLAVILLVALVLRAGWPTLTEFKFSEARLEALALELTRDGRLPLVGVPSSAGFDHSPLSVYLYIPAFLWTSNPVPATVYGGVVNVAALAMCWWLARRWPGGGRQAALTSALLFAVSPWSVIISRKIWQVAFVPILVLALTAWLVSALVEGKRWSLAWAIVTYAVLVQVHPSAVALAPAIVLWLTLNWRQVRLAPLLVGGAFGLLSAVPLVVNQVQQGWTAVTATRAMPKAAWDLSALHVAWDAVTGRGLHTLAGTASPLLEVVPGLDRLYNVVGWVTLAAVLQLAWRMVRGWRDRDPYRRQAARVDLILITWLVVPIAFNLRHTLDLYLHFFVLVVPAAYLLVGRATEGMLRAVQGTRPAAAAALRPAIGCGLVVLAATQVIGLVLMGRFVATHDTPGGFGTPLGRYLDVARQVASQAGLAGAAEVLVVGEGDSPAVHEIPAIFDVLLRGVRPTRFADGHSAAVFPQYVAAVLVAPEAGEAAQWYRDWPSSDLEHGYELYLLDGAYPTKGLTPISGVRLFQNGIELESYAWQTDEEGRGGRLWLLWQVLWQGAEDTHFFAQLVDQDGKRCAQDDAAGYPFVYRRVGDTILSVFDITLSAERVPEPAWLAVGMYTYPSIVNVPVIDQAGQMVGQVVRLGPVNWVPDRLEH